MSGYSVKDNFNLMSTLYVDKIIALKQNFFAFIIVH